MMSPLPLVNEEHVDGFIQVTDEEVIQATRALANTEGIFAGFSSGANIAAALQLLHGPMPGKTVALTINDSGLKYLSTNLWR
jgi:cysteine synthase A